MTAPVVEWRFDDRDAQVAAAKADLKAYWHNLARFGGEGCCLAIEEAWTVDGYPPEIVTAVLSEIADGKSLDDALEFALYPKRP